MGILGTNADRDPVRDLEAYLRGEYRYPDRYPGSVLMLHGRRSGGGGSALSDRVVSRLEVANALRSLPYRQRRVVELLYAEDRPAAEVATRLGVSERTVYIERLAALAAMVRIIYAVAA